MGENNFEFWLTGSFAVLVAGYYTFSNLANSLQRTIMTLYGIVSLVFLIRWVDGAFLIGSYYIELEEQGLDVFPFTFATHVAWLLQTGLIIFGTIATILFLRKLGRGNSGKTT